MAETTITYRFTELREQRDAFVKWMDMLHYGMFDDAIEIGPFNSNQFRNGIFVRGNQIEVKEFTDEFEAGLKHKNYKVSVVYAKDSKGEDDRGRHT